MTFGDKKVAKSSKYFIIDKFVTIIQAIKIIVSLNFVTIIFWVTFGDKKVAKSRKHFYNLNMLLIYKQTIETLTSLSSKINNIY